jgi:hypothetical protein
MIAKRQERVHPSVKIIGRIWIKFGNGDNFFRAVRLVLDLVSLI